MLIQQATAAPALRFFLSSQVQPILKQQIFIKSNFTKICLQPFPKIVQFGRKLQVALRKYVMIQRL